jgi:acetyltransferase-like isoleucine patch superfamily enzyme
MAVVIAKTAIVHPGVVFEGDATIGAYAIVGEPLGDVTAGEVKTRIGDGAHIRSHSVIYAGNTIGKNFQTGHGVLIREQNQIGDDVSVGSSCNIEHHIVIGNRVRLHSGVFVPEYSTLEDDAWLGPRAVLTNARYPKSPRAKAMLRGPRIEKNARVGANVTILPGITVGADSLVGAGAVVSKDVGAGEVVAGNPAAVINLVRNLPYEKQGDENNS